MAAKVLKIDVVVDESGVARRALTELEGGVKKVEAATVPLGTSVQSLDQTMKSWDDRINELEGSIGSVEGATMMATEQTLAWTGALSLGLAVAGAVGSAIYALGNYVKDATEYYIEQSGVLEVNRDAVDSLAKTWDNLKFVIGEVVVGGDGDFRRWIDVANVGLIAMGANLATDIAFYQDLIRLSKEAATGIVMGNVGFGDTDPGSTPGIDTSTHNPDGSLTPYGRLLEQRKKRPGGEFQFGDINGDPYSGATAERMTNEEISRQKREQLELDRQQKAEEAECLKILNEHVKLENDLTQALERSRMEYEREISAAEKLNERKKQALDMSLRDSFMKASMSKDNYSEYQIGTDADRKVAGIDPRASNAAELARRYQAEKEFALLQLRQASEGLTQGVSDDLNHFRAEYQDVIGSLPAAFEEIVPGITAASGDMRDALTSDLDAVRGRTDNAVAGYLRMGAAVRATHEQIAAGLRAADEAYMNAGLMVYRDPGVSRLRGQQTGGLLYAGGGYVEPAYLARGGPAGTDTVPAWLTPGEGVLNRTGMATLDRLNSGLGALGASRGPAIQITGPLVDARGAQFSDDRALELLADKLQQKLAVLNTRFGGTV